MSSLTAKSELKRAKARRRGFTLSCREREKPYCTNIVLALQKEGFIGKEALLKQKAQGKKKKRVGIKMTDAGIPRPKHEIFKNGEKIGYVTSGTFSPLLKHGIAMAYVRLEYAVEGETVNVKIRNKHAKAEIAKFPLYDPNQYGYARK